MTPALLLGIPLVVFSALLAPVQSPPDDGGVFDIEARHGSGAAELDARRSRPAVEARAPMVGFRRAPSTPPRARLLLPSCRGNELPGASPADTMCPQAMQLCAGTADPLDRMFWIYAGPPGVARPTPEQWEAIGQACLTPEQAGGQQAVPVVTGEDFRRLPLPAGRVHIQPSSGQVLVNVPTNVYVEAGQVVLPTTVLGAQVRVRATPISYGWTFGDGGILRTSDPGAAYPDLRTTHTYRRAGMVGLGLTTTYRGEYSVAGGAWQPIDGTASVLSPPQPLTVVEARAVLVDGTVGGS